MRIILFCLCLFCCSSCTKNIHLDLSRSEEEYVIQGMITDSAGGCRVSISTDQDFYDTAVHAGISGATVTITDDSGLTITLPETSTGVYSSPSLAGRPGDTYYLSVGIAGKSYTASSTMPQPVALDSIYGGVDNFFGDSRKVVHAVFKDPPGKGNSYRFVEYVQGFEQSSIFIQNDDINDGISIDNELINFNTSNDNNNNTNNRKIQAGDSIRVVMQCIDPAVYTFWYSLNQSASGSAQAAPDNPVSNISGGAFGYFSAQTVREKSFIFR